MIGSKSFTCWTILSLCVGLISGTAVDQYGRYGTGVSSSTTQRSNSELRCMDINPQNSVDLEQMMGLWYGSEIIVHTQDFPGVYEYDSCVIIHLADVTDQVLLSQQNRRFGIDGYSGYDAQNYNRNQNNYGRTTTPPSYLASDEYPRYNQGVQKFLRLVWSERDNNLEYTFNYSTSSPGKWSNIGDQRGSLVSLNSYTQFTGTVQVVKAVNDHLVLTFCGNDVKSSIYTVVLTRNRLGLSSDELRSIRSLLSRRGLYTETIRKVCNGCGQLTGSFLALITLFLGIRLAGWGWGQ
ncbi:uncharacterized protein Dana_GF10855 [Drosophila ananassae]|uniref:Lipocalin/cytosolic fatty-acid binding domain-containing protein n=1 Tax=Drosophila ananassae TaxID=7217 RepID=B3M8W3_DROAN|nr:uncharacterized protein LOC6493722 [Drosophila ananassae]EDV41114.1 uncharacterized protein Dana_GF10855 [Drosophila ananassae]